MTDYAKTKAAYDNSPIATLLLKGIAEEEKIVDLEVYYANVPAARLWGVTPELLVGMHLISADENSSPNWLNVYQEVQVDHEKKSFYFYSTYLKRNFKVDCFFYSPHIVGCYIRDAEYELGGDFSLKTPDDNRPITELEKSFSALIQNFTKFDESSFDFKQGDDYICYTDIESYRIIDVVARKDGAVRNFIGDDYQGKVYYELFDNAASPQGGFETESLHVDRYRVWQSYNTALQRDYLHRVKLVKIGDEYVRMDVAQDITEGKRKVELLAETFEGMNLWVECVNTLSSEDSFQEALYTIIERTVDFFGSDCGLISLFGPKRYQAVWSDDGLYPEQTIFFNPSKKAIDEWGSLLQGRTQLVIGDATDPRIPQSLRTHFLKRHIHSTLVLPMFIGSRLKGVIAINNPTKNAAQSFVADMIARSIALSFHQLELQGYANKLRFSDSLTGFLNFEGFKHVAEDLIRENPDRQYALWYSDVRRFKFINDMFGYKTGDLFLQYWAQMLSERIKGGDTFCRVSADNFCSLISFDDEEAIRDAFEEMDELLKSYPGLKDQHFRPELVSGVYLLEEEDMGTPDINAIMNKANIAQKSVKALSGSRMAIYNESMKQQQLRELEISQHLEAGLLNKEFYIVVQPQYKYTTKEIVGAEALVRWKHPELGVVSPGEFIPLLEKAGLITDLDKFVWEEACKFIRNLIDKGLGENIVPVSVNISRIDLYLPDLAGFIFGLVKKYELEPSHLKLEITESAYTADSRQLIEVVEDLQQRGFVVEMDDFGSGYSSLNILKEVPVDVLKLDMRFLIVDESNSKRGDNILSSVIRMAHWINLPVIAEGVETKEQAEYLESLGCSMMQGYYFARPMAVEEFEGLIKQAKIGEVTFEDAGSDNLSAAEFLAVNGSTSYLFNNCIGGACLLEYGGKDFEALLINEAFYESFGMDRDKVDPYRTHMLDLFLEEDRRTLTNSFDEAVAQGTSVVYARTIRHSGDSVQWIRGTNHYLASREGKHIIFALVEDVTEQRRSEIRLYEIESELNALTDDSAHRWRTVQHHVMAGLHRSILFDYDVTQDVMAFCSSDHEGCLEESSIERYISEQRFDGIHEDDRPKYNSLITRALEMPMTSSVEFRANYFSKDYKWCRSSYVSLADKSGKVYRVIGRVDDIEAEKQLKRQASKDALTGLLNQTATKSTISAALDKKQHGALIVVDIDDFKEINDSLGHLFGDSFLREVSKKIGRSFREEDVIGRVGGDEFVIFVPRDLERSIVEEKAQAILDIFKGINIPHIGAVHASIGIALVEKGSYQDYAMMFKKADRALYKAKHKGKNQYVVFDNDVEVGKDALPSYGTTKRLKREAADSGGAEVEAWPQTLASDVFSILYYSDNAREGIDKALAHVGNWLDVSRVYVFEKRDDMLFNTFEWCNNDIVSEIDNLQNIPDGDENGEHLYIENFDIDGIFYLRYTQDAPEWQREILEPQNIKSMLQYGIIEKGDLVGFVGFDECNENVFWTRDQVDVLIRIAQTIAVFLKQLRFEETA